MDDSFLLEILILKRFVNVFECGEIIPAILGIQKRDQRLKGNIITLGDVAERHVLLEGDGLLFLIGWIFDQDSQGEDSEDQENANDNVASHSAAGFTLRFHQDFLVCL